MERNEYLIKRKFFKYLFPGIMMVAAMQLGNLVDSIIVGNLLGVNALSAINIGMPIVFLSQFAMILLGTGGSIVSSIFLGKHDKRSASNAFSQTYILVIGISLANLVASIFYAYPLARLLTGGGELTQMTYEFMLTYCLGIPIIAVGYVLSNFLGIDNHPSQSAALHIVANILNLASDFIFIKYCGLGISGSVYSTILGYGVAGIIFAFIYSKSKRRTLSFVMKKSVFELKLFFSSVKSGLPAGLMLLFSALKIGVLNAAVLAMTGDAGMAVYAVCVNSFFLVQLGLHGVSGVIQTISGVLYGEKDFYGIRYILKKVIVISTGIAIALNLLFVLAPGVVEGMFGFDMPAMKQVCDLALQIYSASFLLYAFNNILQTYYATIEKPILGTINTILQGMVILIPLTLCLLPFTGVVGTSIASVGAELLAFVIVMLVRIIMQKKGKLDGTHFDALPDRNEHQFADITVSGASESASSTAHKMYDICLDLNLTKNTANTVAIAVEELIDNIRRYGSGINSFVDICLYKDENGLLLRVRDDGPIFNPLKDLEDNKDDAFDEDGILKVTGLRLIYSIATKLDYTRVLDLNNTIVEFPLEYAGGEV